MREEARYIEMKSGYNDDGPAWIAKVRFSKSGKTIYFNGMALKSCKGAGIGANYYDYATGEEYWISGIKKQEWNRHWAGSGKVMIERSLLEWYKTTVNFQDLGFLEIIEDMPPTDIRELHDRENESSDAPCL
ncbi:MAG: hypothetical protein L0229_02070 [Blastocatellia bacterium]|nr:hypothetical protein [Blastocatellia bacterium]